MYGFHLSDNQYWGIQPGIQTGEWAAKFARLLGIEPLQDCPDRTIRLETLTMTTSGENGCRWLPQYGYPGEEWQVRILRSLEQWRHPAISDVIFRLRQTTDPRQVRHQMRHVFSPVYDLTIQRGGLPLHAALVEHSDRGLLLVGRSGVGKTTACRRLPIDWNVLSDDLALAVRTSDGGFRVHPLPTWSAVRIGSTEHTWDIKQSVKLSAVFFLAQAAKDEVTPAGKAMASVILNDAAMTVFNSLQAGPRYLEESFMFGKLFSNAATMAQAVPSYIFRLSLQGRFWEKIEEVLAKGKQSREMLYGETGVGLGASTDFRGNAKLNESGL